MDKEKIRVVFRAYPDGEIIALFPELAVDMNHGHCASYMHVGQHGAADPHLVIRQTRPAKPSEHLALCKELMDLGYNLRICKRIPHAVHRLRHAAVQQLLYA